jgi:VanZ family protein
MLIGPARKAPWGLLFWSCGISILVLALLPTEAPLPTTGWDKTNHALAFGVLAALGVQTYPKRLALVLAGSILYGGLIELLQALTSYRFAEWEDVAADAVGVLIGYGAMALARSIARRRWTRS